MGTAGKLREQIGAFLPVAILGNPGFSCRRRGLLLGVVFDDFDRATLLGAADERREVSKVLGIQLVVIECPREVIGKPIERLPDASDLFRNALIGATEPVHVIGRWEGL